VTRPDTQVSDEATALCRIGNARLWRRGLLGCPAGVVHSLRHLPMPRPERLLPQAVAVGELFLPRPLPGRLLPQALAVPSLLHPQLLSGRLLLQAIRHAAAALL